MLTETLGRMPVIRYVIIEPKIYIDVTPLLPLTYNETVPFHITDGRVNDYIVDYYCSDLAPTDLQYIVHNGVIDLWIFANGIEELIKDESERLRIETAMARVHVC